MSAMWTLYLRMQISAPAAESLALNSVGDSYSRSEYDIMSAMWTLYLRMQISAPAAESLALNSVGDSYSRSGYDIITGEQTACRCIPPVFLFIGKEREK